MELIVLGAGPAYTDRRGAAAASFLVRAGGAGGPAGERAAGGWRADGPGGDSGEGGSRAGEGGSVVLDLGQGAFSNLAATVEPSTLAAVLVTHLHPDHFIDLIALRHYLRWEFDPSRRVRVVAPAGLADRLDALLAEPGFAAVTLDVETAREEVRRIGPFEVETRRVAHTEDSYAIRVSEGPRDFADGGSDRGAGGGSDRGADGKSRGLVYSGDCGRAGDLLPLIRPRDVLLAEATFGAGPVPEGTEHLSSADAARVAASAGASRLLLSHVLSGHSRSEMLAAAQAVFSGPVQLVTEGDRFLI